MSKHNLKGLGKDQRKMLGFFAGIKGVHSLAVDPDTQRIARSLVKRGLLEALTTVVTTGRLLQVRYSGPEDQREEFKVWWPGWS